MIVLTNIFQSTARLSAGLVYDSAARVNPVIRQIAGATPQWVIRPTYPTFAACIAAFVDYQTDRVVAEDIAVRRAFRIERYVTVDLNRTTERGTPFWDLFPRSHWAVYLSPSLCRSMPPWPFPRSFAMRCLGRWRAGKWWQKNMFEVGQWKLRNGNVDNVAICWCKWSYLVPTMAMLRVPDCLIEGKSSTPSNALIHLRNVEVLALPCTTFSRPVSRAKFLWMAICGMQLSTLSSANVHCCFLFRVMFHFQIQRNSSSTRAT